MTKVLTQPTHVLDALLTPGSPRQWIQQSMAPDIFLTEVLMRIDALIPSHAGAILFDNEHNELVFAACFGDMVDKLIGKVIPASQGIAGQVFRTGKPYICVNTQKDPYFYSQIDENLGLYTSSIICAPLYDSEKVRGVIELLYRGNDRYSMRDLKILEVFSEYTSLFFQNCIHAKLNHELAQRDDLSGLHNDRYFHAFISEIIEKAEKESTDLGLLFLDLDHFKEIVDTFGHLIGSRLLAELGSLLRAAVTDNNAKLFRYGGDEYVVVIYGASINETVLIGEEIRQTIESSLFLKGVIKNYPEGIGQELTASIGVASLRSRVGFQSDVSILKESFIHAADTAMYRAKRSGKNKVCVVDQWKSGPDICHFNPFITDP